MRYVTIQERIAFINLYNKLEADKQYAEKIGVKVIFVKSKKSNKNEQILKEKEGSGKNG